VDIFFDASHRTRSAAVVQLKRKNITFRPDRWESPKELAWVVTGSRPAADNMGFAV
jgi:hypothetical protein